MLFKRLYGIKEVKTNRSRSAPHSKKLVLPRLPKMIPFLRNLDAAVGAGVFQIHQLVDDWIVHR